MKITRFATFSFLLFSVLHTACASERIYDVQERRYVPRGVLVERMAMSDDVVVAEKHDTASIQNAEARLFADFAGSRRSRVTFAWEFWAWSDRTKLQAAYTKFRDGSFTAEEFLRAVFGEKNPQLTYAPLIRAVRDAGADVLATNLTRSEKSPVVRGGIGALDPALLPPGFALGGEAYFERFAAEMEGHGTPEEVRNYFAAQSLVDDVCAHHFVAHRATPSAFLVIGSFHARYFDGVWKRIESRSSVSRIRTLIEIADPEDETGWEAVIRHPKYGAAADFVLFTR